MSRDIKSDPNKIVAQNRRARFDYELVEIFECGMVLTGAEVKSLRAGQASLSEAFARIRDGEVWLENMHIPPYSQAHKSQVDYDPRQRRKLLLHKREIDRLIGKTAERGLTLVPVKVYFFHGLAKCTLALGKGKKEHEKRASIAEREAKRDIERESGRRG